MYSPLSNTTSTVILFCVNVPVLSEHITDTEPMVSHASFLVTSALILAILFIVTARVIFIRVGSPSGTAATINATQTVNAVLIGSIDSKNGKIPLVSMFNISLVIIFNIIMMNNRPEIPPDIIVIFFPKAPSFT